MKVAAHILIKGRVQGVGFRYFAMREASLLGVTGYVKNLPNGAVEVYVEGEHDIIESYKRILKEGPSFGRVDNLEVNDMPYQNKYNNFSVEF